MSGSGRHAPRSRPEGETLTSRHFLRGPLAIPLQARLDLRARQPATRVGGDGLEPRHDARRFHDLTVEKLIEDPKDAKELHAVRLGKRPELSVAGQ